MRVDVLYVGLDDRKRQVAAQELQARRMLSDTFAEGMISAGTMVFTDELPVQVADQRDIPAQFDALIARVKALEAKP